MASEKCTGDNPEGVHAGTVAAADETKVFASWHGASRRRLLRGLAAATPVILTVRSGSALAAVSCAGGYVQLVPQGQSAQFTDPATVLIPEALTCPENERKLAPMQPGVGTVTVGDFCSPDGQTNPTYTCNGPFAVVSSTAASSIVWDGS